MREPTWGSARKGVWCLGWQGEGRVYIWGERVPSEQSEAYRPCDNTTSTDTLSIHQCPPILYSTYQESINKEAFVRYSGNPSEWRRARGSPDFPAQNSSFSWPLPGIPSDSTPPSMLRTMAGSYSASECFVSHRNTSFTLYTNWSSLCKIPSTHTASSHYRNKTKKKKRKNLSYVRVDVFLYSDCRHRKHEI